MSNIIVSMHRKTPELVQWLKDNPNRPIASQDVNKDDILLLFNSSPLYDYSECEFTMDINEYGKDAKPINLPLHSHLGFRDIDAYGTDGLDPVIVDFIHNHTMYVS